MLKDYSCARILDGFQLVCFLLNSLTNRNKFDLMLIRRSWKIKTEKRIILAIRWTAIIVTSYLIPFSKARRKRTLALNIVYRIVNKYEGTIDVETREQMGTTFCH